MSAFQQVIRRDLVGRTRRRWFYLRRVAFVSVMGVLLMVVFGHALFTRTTTAGLWSFSWIAFFLLCAACLVAPWTAAASIAQEREDRTLGLLLLSDIRPLQVVLGKLFSPVFATAILVCSGLPLMVLCGGQGGIDTPQILGGVGIILSTVFVGACLGLAVSSVSATTRGAFAGVFLAILILFWGLPSGVYGWCLLVRPDLVNIARFVSPFEALQCALDGDSVSGWWNILFNVGLGLSLLAAACVAVPWRAREKETGFMRATVRRRGDSPATGNPVAWKEGVASLTMRMRWLLAGLLVATCFFAAHYLVDTRMVKELFEDRVDDPVVVAARVTGVLSLLIIIIGTVVASATAYSREKRTRALELLLISELSETDVVLGKMWHCVRSSRPWFVVLIVMMGVNTLWDEDVEECWKIGLALAALAPLLPAVASVGLHASLCYRAGTAAAIAVMAAIVCVLLWAGALDTGPWSVLTIILVYMAIGAVYLRKTSHRLMQLSCGERTW